MAWFIWPAAIRCVDDFCGRRILSLVCFSTALPQLPICAMRSSRATELEDQPNSTSAALRRRG